MLALLEHLCFRGVEIFRLASIQTATAEADHTALTIADGHHHAMTETVVEAITAFTRHNQTRSFQELGSESLHLLEVLEQSIPLIGCIPELELFERGFVQTACLAQIAQGISPLGCSELRTEPTRRKRQSAMQLVAA